ncbi:MAG: cytochrome c oxidase subunit 3 [Actinomycetota bacterium]
MTIALPAAPAPTPRRQILVATAMASASAFMLIMGMIAMWLKFRAGAPTRNSSDGLLIIKDWMPVGITIPEVAANIMLITFPVGALMAQWAAYSAKRNDAPHRSLALAICFVMGLAIVNAQVAVYSQMKIGLADGMFQTMFYAITGTMLLLVIGGMAFSLVAFFRSVGGRNNDTDVVNAHALYWYFLTAAFAVVWFVVYVQK